MQPILYATGNAVKFHQARTTCAEFSISLDQAALDVPEIQAESGAIIAQDKARQAFEQFKRPVIVSDDSWIIPGLNGFPGPYMKYMNDWLNIDDWLHLTGPLTDRRITLQQCVVYYDDAGPHAFSCDLEGVILTEPRGETKLYPHNALVSFDGGNLSAAEYHQTKRSATAHLSNVWHDFAAWYGNQSKS